MLLCSIFLQACSTQKEIIYTQIPLAVCPEPKVPQLPQVTGDLANETTIRILIEREKQVRSYIVRLRKSLECYNKQVTQ